ncbi:AMP-dependent synthetase/ligase [Pseudonocardia kujensis]|uniref:AMP-dependent synthetase/ligase n=1 Tax=Pseudonocardia kujensis TaxID=1128675 RepID=UPI001E45D0E0|nr:AMP-dependent synthetase/ligase [Pseudonocardia kujensis]MCE0764867.1 AMP-dependent synthetase/ligase [Pseudonocardia kujensis]
MTAVLNPSLVTLPGRGGIAAEILRRLEAVGERPVLAALRPTWPERTDPAGPADGYSWADLTGRELAGRIRAVAGGLRSDGIRAGDRVALLGGNTPDWIVLDLAVLAAGAITVPIYPTASRIQIEHVLADSGATRVFAETPSQVELSRGEPFAEAVARLSGGEAPDAGEIGADDIATIVYTSGTTGTPKGCVLTHRNLFAAAGNVVTYLPELFARDDASTLLFLPLSHVFGRVSALGCLWAGVRTGLLASAAELAAELPRFRPSFLVLVPYALEKLRKGARAGGLTPELESEAVAAGAAWSGSAAETFRAALGGRLDHVICGGAPLDPTTAAFTAALGVQVLGAYGLTESTTVVSMSSPSAVEPGRVGRALPGCEVLIADDGEILVRGEQVSPGYWPLVGEPEPWLRTGDLGEVDRDGFLAITGRRKEIIVTSGGKNVAPEPLEDRIRLHAGVAHAVVIGEGRPYVSALVFPEPGALLDDAAVEAAVDDANTLVSRAESIRRWRIVDGALSVADGTLTPSLKLRRAAVAERYAADIAALYS